MLARNELRRLQTSLDRHLSALGTRARPMGRAVAGYSGVPARAPTRRAGFSGVPASTLQPDDHGSSDGQPKSSSNDDVAEDQAEKQRIERERKKKQRDEANEGAETDSPGSEKSAIGPMGDKDTIVGDKYSADRAHGGIAGARFRARQIGLGSRGMTAFTASLARQMVAGRMI